MKHASYTYRRPGETLTDWHKRDFAACMMQMERCHVLQDQRRAQGFLGAALFYQHHAARWYDRAQAALARWRIASSYGAARLVLAVNNEYTPPFILLDGSNHPD